MRKISELGFKKTHESNSELVLALNMIPALSFVPESKLKIGFDLVIEEICCVATKKFQKLDVSQNDLGRKPLFPIFYGTIIKLLCVV